MTGIFTLIGRCRYPVTRRNLLSLYTNPPWYEGLLFQVPSIVNCPSLFAPGWILAKLLKWPPCTMHMNESNTFQPMPTYIFNQYNIHFQPIPIYIFNRYQHTFSTNTTYVFNQYQYTFSENKKAYTLNGEYVLHGRPEFNTLTLYDWHFQYSLPWWQKWITDQKK